MNNSNFFSLNWLDLGKGLVVAVLTVVLQTVLELISDGSMPTAAEWKSIGGVALTAAVAYLLKNLLTNNNGEPLKTDTSANKLYSK